MNMQEFLVKFSTDQALAEKMSRSASADEAYATAKEAGLTESFETFVAAMKKLNDVTAEMSDKEVDNVTGGIETTYTVIVTLFTSATVSGISATAASL